MAAAGLVRRSRSKRRRWNSWILLLLVLLVLMVLCLRTTLLLYSPNDDSSNPMILAVTPTTIAKSRTTFILANHTKGTSTKVNHRNNDNSSEFLLSSPTIVSILHAQFGNQLSTIAEAIAISLHVREHHGIHANVSIRFLGNRRDHMKDMNTCFPQTRSLGNDSSDDIGPWEQAQASYWNDTDYAKRLVIDRTASQKQVDEVLTYWQEQLLLLQQQHPQQNTTASTTTFVPYVGVLRFLTPDLLDQYYDQLRDFFQWNNHACCKTKPDADESVFHFRNFAQEWNSAQRAQDYGFEELGPNQTALELFGHLQAGEKIAITTIIPRATLDNDPQKQQQRRRRRPRDNDKRVVWTVEQYVTALEARGLRVRVVSGQSAMEDFCFLLHAQKELVGSRVSTFAKWAAYLGNVTRARLYFVESNRKNLAYGDDFEPYNWTHPILKDRMEMLQFDPRQE